MNKIGKNLWFAIDGDDMGSSVEDVLLENDTKKAEEFSNSIHQAFASIEAFVKERGGDVVFRGGDNMLFSAPDVEAQNIADSVRNIYQSITDHSATLGMGEQPLEAHKALVVGKNLGKDQIVIWGSDKEAIYEEIKEKQKDVEECVEKSETESLTPSIKYKAQLALTHYRRFIGMGYDHKQALSLVESQYKLGDSFRDILQRKKNLMKGDTPIEKSLRDGEEQYDAMIKNLENPGNLESKQTMQPMEPVLGQKIVAQHDLGRIIWVGPRFISVRWLKEGNLERISRRRFASYVSNSHFVVIQKIRVAENKKVKKEGTHQKIGAMCAGCGELMGDLCSCNYCETCRDLSNCPHSSKGEK